MRSSRFLASSSPVRSATLRSSEAFISHSDAFCARVSWFRRLTSERIATSSSAWRTVARSSWSFQGLVSRRKISPQLIASIATWISA